jgi:hypothetical protein
LGGIPSGEPAERRDRWVVNLIRCGALAFTLLVAVACPAYSTIIGFCSWIFAPSLVVAMPVACYVKLFPEEAAANPVGHWLRKAAIVLSLAVSVVGTVLPLVNAYVSQS